VSLRIHVGPNGAPVKVNNISFGDVIYDKEDVEDRLRRAQLAIISPSRNAQEFLGDSYENSPELTFSANCVVLEITGPELEDLSFIDLPGTPTFQYTAEKSLIAERDAPTRSHR